MDTLLGIHLCKQFVKTKLAKEKIFNHPNRKAINQKKKKSSKNVKNQESNPRISHINYRPLEQNQERRFRRSWNI